MAFTRHGSSLVQVTRLRFVNAYLVREDDGATVVDTTLKGGAQAILDAARAVGAPIRRLTVTHGHGDYVGSLDTLAERLPDAEVVLPARETRLMADDLSRTARLRNERPDDEDGLSARGDPTGADARPGRPARLARGRGRPGPHAGTARVPRHPRREAPVRRCLRDVDRTVTSVRPTLRSPCQPSSPGTARPRWRLRVGCVRSSRRRAGACARATACG